MFFVFLGFFGHTEASGILVPQPGIEPRPSAVRAWSPNHWTTREFPGGYLIYGIYNSPSQVKAKLLLCVYFFYQVHRRLLVYCLRHSRHLEIFLL